MRKWPPNDYRLGKDFRFYCFWQLKTGRKILIFELTSWTMIDWYDQKATFSNQLENYSTKIIQLGSSTGSIFHLVGNFMLGPVGTILSHRYSLNFSAVRCWSKTKVMVRDRGEPISGTYPSPVFPLIFKKCGFRFPPGSRQSLSPFPSISGNDYVLYEQKFMEFRNANNVIKLSFEVTSELSVHKYSVLLLCIHFKE